MEMTYDTELMRLLAGARWEAYLGKKSAVDSSDLLVAFFHLPLGRTGQALVTLGVEPKWARPTRPVAADQPSVWPPPPDSPAVQMALGPDAAALLSLAAEDAVRRGRAEVAAVDLALAILNNDRGLAGMLLRCCGLTPAKAKKALLAAEPTTESHGLTN